AIALLIPERLLKGETTHGQEGHRTLDGVDGRPGGQGGRVQPVVERGAPEGAPRRAGLPERRPLRGGEGGTQAPRRLRAREPGRAREPRLQEGAGQSHAVDQALLAR